MNLDAAKAIIRKNEGLKLSSYICPAGKLTIGYGHTKNVLPNQTITKETAEVLLDQDCKEVLKQLVNTLVYFKALNENEINALVSFTFNLGIGKVEKSTLFKMLNEPAVFNAEQKKIMANEFPKWIYTNGKVLNGLVTRREEERQLFLRPIDANNADV